MDQMTQFLAKIDWNLLDQQKRYLMDRVWNESKAPEWGIIGLIDDLQDLAVNGGYYPADIVFPVRTEGERDTARRAARRPRTQSGRAGAAYSESGL